MKVTKLDTEKTGSGINYGGEKELYRTFNYICLWNKHLLDLITLRIYTPRRYRGSGRVYATIWVHDRKNQRYFSGSGWAGGYGYDKASAAASGAMRKAGIMFDKEISGVGESAIREALEAIARKLGYRTTKNIIVTN